jgi:hypothetical protein
MDTKTYSTTSNTLFPFLDSRKISMPILEPEMSVTNLRGDNDDRKVSNTIFQTIDVATGEANW